MSQEPWGRVDETGSVFVRTADGERQIGSWQAGSPDEALAFYTTRYDNLVAEVRTLEERLRSGHAEPAAAQTTISRLREQITNAAVIGDLDSLASRLDGCHALVQQRRDDAKQAKQAEREAAVAAREAIVTEAETLATKTSWKVTGERFKELLEQWQSAPRVDRSTEQSLWKRFSAARTAFDRARRTHFAQRSTEQAEAKTVKESLVKQAEALADSSDFKQTPKSFRDLMAKWKAAGRAGKSDEEALWSRFKAAQDAFFARLGQENEKTEAEQRENLGKKQALVQRAQALLPLTDLGSAKTTLREIAKEWEGIGPVPRDERAKVEGALRKVEDAVRAAEQEQWRKSDPVARGRAQSTVDQLTTAIDKLRKQLHAAEAAGDERKASEAREAIEARQQWLAQAEAALQEFSG